MTSHAKDPEALTCVVFATAMTPQSFWHHDITFKQQSLVSSAKQLVTMAPNTSLVLIGCLSAASAFQIPSRTISSSALFMAPTKEKADAIEKVKEMFEDAPAKTDYDDMITSFFPGAISNKELEERVVSKLAEKGYTSSNTLLATSLCCDELARRLEDDFVAVYGNNFNLGGLSGFPFAGNTGCKL